jgi:hypothetical protein
MRSKHLGVDSFFAEKKKLLDSYDRAKEQNSEESIHVDHGVVAESLVRQWLRTFLPKRFGVTKGYIITSSLTYEGTLEEWDVIIYDALESPILYTKGDPEAELKQAIPVEHVRGILEVKATLTPDNVKRVSAKLLKLRKFIDINSPPEYPSTLQAPFVSAAIFFETKVSSLDEYRRALDNFIELFSGDLILPFLGSLVLRSQRYPLHTGYINMMFGKEPLKMADAFETSSDFSLPGNNWGTISCLTWAPNNFPTFIFDLLACLKGTKTQRASSFYGLDFENVEGSRLFWGP